MVAAQAGLASALEGADLVITGEGAMDGQSLRGKVPVGVARMAGEKGVPCIVLAGRLGDGCAAAYNLGITAAFALAPGPVTREESMENALDWLADRAEALARLSTEPLAARGRYLAHLKREPSLVMATRWLADEPLSDPTAQVQVRSALEQASNPLKRYRCAACGFEARQHFWQCPGCQSWDSYPARRVEEL